MYVFHAVKGHLDAVWKRPWAWVGRPRAFLSPGPLTHQASFILSPILPISWVSSEPGSAVYGLPSPCPGAWRWGRKAQETDGGGRRASVCLEVLECISTMTLDHTGLKLADNLKQYPSHFIRKKGRPRSHIMSWPELELQQRIFLTLIIFAADA